MALAFVRQTRCGPSMNGVRSAFAAIVGTNCRLAPGMLRCTCENSSSAGYLKGNKWGPPVGRCNRASGNSRSDPVGARCYNRNGDREPGTLHEADEIEPVNTGGGRNGGSA